MLRYVQALDGKFVRHINDIEPTQWDENNYCFARKLPPEKATEFGVTKLKIVTPPYFNPATQKRVEVDAFLNDGVWTQKYEVIELDNDEAVAKNNEQARIVRNERDRLLANCDWTQVADTKVNKEAWAIYRQALRDLPDQAGFPFDVVYPDAP
jgi:hypothetical protein